MRTAIIFASSNRDGNTRTLVEELKVVLRAEVFDFADYEISFYDYDHKNIDDDFIRVIQSLLEFEHIVFATPMYWYSMSAQLKVFFDRLSDLLTVRKELGRQFRNRECSLVATGYDNEPPECLSEPVKLTAEYLGMTYRGMLYVPCPNGYKHDEALQHIAGYRNDLKIAG